MDAVAAIEDVPLFSHLPSQELAELARAAQMRGFATGETVFSQGDVPQFLYVVQSGAVDIVLPTRGEEIILASFEAGSFFGELAVFDRQRRTASARAAADTTLLCVPLDAVAALLEGPAAARHFMGVVIQRLRSADELLSRLQIRNVNEIADERMGLGGRVADMVARFGGSWTFIISFGVFLVGWAVVNSLVLVARPLDPYPYIFLNLILSCIAALQAPIIMMSQNRQAAKDRLQADQDFQVNVKAEFAIQQLHRKIDDLRASLAQHRRVEAQERRSAPASVPAG
jgi:CRP/FNR family transcriptional regulator, cyclic AMP receptor protein